ncbi:MAG: adenylosuccinate lyase [Acidobacteria bacterium]|uniref:Adenylosuccinate lyase n=1 Tax=Candidatus Sulfomarinibacter kjeldsenii TaxID=2885994 RepID=A0A8J6XWU4_9BACT|nr:adenylosuccinate lyase [Candidatus Sulfomarinibacter kjeldsenii]MBD3855472.1 adenylosuccinate lyase [Candidatus Sulfomarinibacter kjeldsenii]MBD3870327.1 adenylosuccinate lyase [Candidatus Sulfomarinibacter kjeldsenii]
MTSLDRFDHPLTGRYASEEMQRLFSTGNRYTTWRRLWLALASAESELGLEIPTEALEQMLANLEVTADDLERVREYEKRTRHDVMAHLEAFADLAPAAKPILHLGATSAYVGDNADLIITRDALDLVITRVLAVVAALAAFAEKWADEPALGMTHFQPAQPTTVGKRACLWLQDFLLDLERLRFERERLQMRGVKGTTGTQATFLELFDGDHDKVRALDRRVAETLGFSACYPVTGQTYPRKVDAFVIDALSGVGQSAAKLATDIRLLARLKELREPLAEGQVGSSAMPYKANPMRSERVTALSRWLISIAANPAQTAASQWLERTLDDSANRRLALPEAFLSTDAILRIVHNIADGLQVFPAMIARNLAEELPLMASEAILMEAVRRGGDRQAVHERLRLHARVAATAVLEEGGANPFLALVADDPEVALDRSELDALLDPARFVGRAPQQVREFLAEHVQPVLDEAGDLPEAKDLDV